MFHRVAWLLLAAPMACVTSGSPITGDGGDARPDAPADAPLEADPDLPLDTAEGPLDLPPEAADRLEDSAPDRTGDAPGDAPGDAADAGACEPEGEGMCDLVCQTGCTPSKKCTVDLDTGEPTCVTNGSVAEGEPCSGSPDNCRRGLICLGSAPPRCRAFCRRDEDCAATRTRCDTTVAEWPHRVCGRPPDTCDPLDPTAACPAGTGCYVGRADSDTHCYAAGTAGAGEACVRLNDCRPGLICLGTRPDEYACMELCRRPDGACRTAGTTCRAIPGLERYGVCREPPAR